MRRDLRHITIVSLLLWSLLHAWSGHDLIQDHDHDLGEASYSTALQRTNTDQVIQLATVALLTSFCHLLVAAPTDVVEVQPFADVLLIDPQFLEKVHSPRAPPAPPLAV